MRQDYEQLFQQLDRLEPSSGLFSRILERIYVYERRVFVARLASFGVLAFSSFAGVIFAFRYVLQEFSESSFFSYFSLLFSDSSVILASSDDFVLSLLEATSFSGITVFLFGIFVLFGCFRFIANITTSYTHAHVRFSHIT